MKGNKANARGGSNQPSSIGIGIGEEELPSAKNIGISIYYKYVQYDKYRLQMARKEDSQYGGPTLKKKKKKKKVCVKNKP